MTGLDIVVVNFKTPHDLTELLNSIAANPPTCEYTTTIVNVTPDSLSMKIGDDPKWDATHMSTETNFGYNRAVNLAGSVGQHDVIVAMNADVQVPAGGFDECAAALRAHPEWGILGPRQIDKQRRLTAAGIFNDKHRGWREYDRGQYVDVRPDASMVAGSIVFHHRAVWDLLTQCDLEHASDRAGTGPWLATARHYYGDKWLASHCTAHGYACCYYGPSTWLHKWHQATTIGGYGEMNASHDENQYLKALSIHRSVP